MGKGKRIKEQRKQEEQEFWNGNPTRQEVANIVKNVMSQGMGDVNLHMSMSFAVLREILIEKGVCTQEELEAKGKEIEEKVKESQEAAKKESEEKHNPQDIHVSTEEKSHECECDEEHDNQ